MKLLNSFKDFYKGKDIIVCGCGESLRELTHPERFITIGVNDVGRLFHPEYPEAEITLCMYRETVSNERRYKL